MIEGYTLYQLLFFFIIYSVLGWIGEVSYAALDSGKFVNRGFLNGPVCPIYGVGIVLVILCLTPVKDNIVLLYIGAVIITSVVEWLTGFILEKVFCAKWWDYSDMPFNINGYVCLKFSLGWGIACLLIINIFHPLLGEIIALIPSALGWVIVAASLLLLAIDGTATVMTITKFNRRLKQIDEVAARLKITSDRLGGELYTDVNQLLLKSEEFKADINELKADVLEIKEDIEEFKDSVEQKSRANVKHFKETVGQFRNEAEHLKDSLPHIGRLSREQIKESADRFMDNVEQFKEKAAAVDLQDLLSEGAEHLKDKAEDFKQSLLELREEQEELLALKHRGQHRLLKAFPKMKSTKYPEILKKLKDHLD